MNSFTPRLEIYPQKIELNATAICNLCHTAGIQVAGVSKACCAHLAVVTALQKGGVDMLADSRLENLHAIRAQGIDIPLMLLRSPTPNQADQVVQIADISLNTAVETIQALSAAASRINEIHKIFIMVESGDLREGVPADQVLPLLSAIARLPNIEVLGLGTNLMCYGGIIPSRDKMDDLVRLRDYCRSKSGLELPMLSGGNSANLPLVLHNEMPAEINHLRLGETILLGRNVIDRTAFPDTSQDSFMIVAQVIELTTKPSLPFGHQGQNAFGEQKEFFDRGNRKRAICNLGLQDVVIENLQALDSGIIILGGSSDHLILDVEDANSSLAVGQEIVFSPGYAALLAASTSPYVQKTVMKVN